MTGGVRAPAVAGRFYSADAAELQATVDAFVAEAAVSGPTPKAIVAPHAGYIYSGPIAGSAYAQVAALADFVTRIVLLGPAHHARLFGIAAPAVNAFRTPLGDVAVDTAARDAIRGLPGVVVDDGPHGGEHSLEVHLPFLQRLFPAARVLPLVVGRTDPETVAAVLDALWGGPETLIVVSSDLSHYEPHDSAVTHDRRTADAVLTGTGAGLNGYDACGVTPLRGLLVAADRHGLCARLLDLRTSGDTAGNRDRVVGYGAFAFAFAESP